MRARLLLPHFLAAGLAALFLCSAAMAADTDAEKGVRVLVRPMTADADLAALRSSLRARPIEEASLSATGISLWVSPLAEQEVRAVLSRRRPSIASEVISRDHRQIAWPVKPSSLTERAKSNLAKIERLRAYAGRRGLVQILSPEFASPMLRRGLPADRTLGVASSLKWKLTDDLAFTSTRVGLKSNPGGGFAWVGELDAKPRSARVPRYEGGFAAGTFLGGHLYARFEHRDSIYQLVPLGDSFHVLLEVLPGKVPEGEPDVPRVGDSGVGEPDTPSLGDCGNFESDVPRVGDSGVGEPDVPRVGDSGVGEPDVPRVGDSGVGEPDVPRVGDSGVGEPDFLGFCPSACIVAPTIRGEGCYSGPRTCANIRIGVGYTREALEQLPSISSLDARHFAQYLVDLASASFARSGVYTRVHLGGVETFPSLETQHQDIGKLITALVPPLSTSAPSTTPSASVQAVRQWRDRSGSDVVMILSTLEVLPGVGNVAGLSPPKARVRDPRSAYSIVVERYADANLSFIHELGHHLGAYHNPGATGSPPFSYAQGFRNGCKWRTIMAYGKEGCGANENGRVLMWSSCNLWYKGVLAGGANQNNVRIINTMSGWVAGFRP